MATDYMQAAIAAAQAGGAVLRDRLGKVKIEYKSGFTDLVTEADRSAENAVVQVLQEAFPDHGFWGEERGDESGGASHRWVIDPLDGTTNFAHGVPLFAVSIALEVHGEIQAGVIYHPIMDEMYTAEPGAGAFLNGQRLQVSDTDSLERSLLVTGFPYELTGGRGDNFDMFATFTMRTRGVRRLGSAALDLAYVAAGRLDGFWESGLSPWDVAAGWLLVREAGGRVSDRADQPYRLGCDDLVASNGHLHQAMLDVLNQPAGARS